LKASKIKAYAQRPRHFVHLSATENERDSASNKQLGCKTSGLVSLVAMVGGSSKAMDGVHGRHGWCPHQPSIDAMAGIIGAHGFWQHERVMVSLDAMVGVLTNHLHLI